MYLVVIIRICVGNSSKLAWNSIGNIYFFPFCHLSLVSSLCFSELVMILSMAQTNPVMFDMVADRPGVSKQLELMGRLKELLETDQEKLNEKQRDDWIRWVCQYR